MTNEQLRQRIAELEEGLRYLNTEIDAMWNDPEKRQIHEFYMKSITNAQIHAASLLSPPPSASEPDADVVERVAKEDLLPCPFCGSRAEWCTIEDGDDLGGSYIECANSACMATTRLEFSRKENLTSMWNARAALSAMRPAIDREKLAEIRARHTHLDGQLSNRTTEITAYEGYASHDDRAALLEMIGGPDAE